ncbi:MAG: Crp/Fnr family transcriptional regulator [Thermoplasmata archaeon]|nr:MAG: Crp/Fnr family transcriptional regulator [Thermoplasmata archaeon]
MDIFELVGNFWAEDQRAHLTSNATRLYFFLIHEANRKFWRGPLYLSWSYLQGALGLCRDSLSRAISDLKSRDLIIYEKRGKKATFWFPWSAEQTENQTNISHRSVRRTENQTANQTDNQTDNQTENQTINNNTLKQENNKTKDKEKISIFPNGNMATKVANEPPAWYKNLGKYQREIIDTWRTIVSPFHPSWIPLVDEALKICYPQQIKNAIITFAKTRPETIKDAGFEYIIKPLKKGMFGRRLKREKAKSVERDPIERFKNPAGKETISDEDFEQYIITGNKRGSA